MILKTPLTSKGEQALKKYRSIIFFAILTLITTAFIFSNSLKDITESTADSDSIITIIKSFLDRFFITEHIDWHFLVRKAAHFVEFCILGVFVAGLARSMEKCFARRYIAAPILYCLMVAVADEYLQSFQDRTSSVSDVVLDFFGAVFGILIITLIARIFKKQDRKVQ